MMSGSAASANVAVSIRIRTLNLSIQGVDSHAAWLSTNIQVVFRKQANARLYSSRASLLEEQSVDTIASRTVLHWLVVLIAAALLTATASAQETAERSGTTLRIEDAARVIQLQQILERRELEESDVRITDFEGRVIRRDVLTLEPAPEATTQHEPLQRLENQFIVRPAETLTMRLTTEQMDLPGGVAVTRPDDSVSEEPEGWFHPTLAASPTPAVWDERLRRYRMRLSLGLRSENLPSNASLQQPVTVQFGYRGLIADPFDAVTIEHAGVENEVHLEFLFLPTAEQPVLELRSAITDIDFQIEAMPRIELRPVRDSMMGLGLDEVQVRVLRLLPHGAPANDQGNLTATVEITTGSAVPEPSELVFREGETQTTFRLRSQGLDDATIRVTAGAHSDSRVIQQQFPTGPLLATLIGGVIGGFSRRFARNANGGSTVARIVEGLAVAVIAYVAGVLGVGYLGMPAVIVGTEAGAFLTGALTGFVGVTVIEALSKRLSLGR